MTTEPGDHDQDDSNEEPELPEDPRARPTETVQALEDKHADDDPDTEEPVPGDDVSDAPDADEMEGLPGPPSGQPDEPAG